MIDQFVEAIEKFEAVWHVLLVELESVGECLSDPVLSLFLHFNFVDESDNFQFLLFFICG